MLSARLFAAMASMALLIAVLDREKVLPYMSFRLVVGHFLLNSFHSLLLIAMISANLAFWYYSINWFVRYPTNEAIGLIGFMVKAVAFVVRLILSLILGRSALPNIWQLLILSGTVYAFYVGLFLSIVNLVRLTWALWRHQL